MFFSIIYIVSGSTPETVERSEADIQKEKRDLSVEFIFCLVLIEVLRQLSFHPGHEDLVKYIEDIAFKHFKYREGYLSFFSMLIRIFLCLFMFDQVVNFSSVV